MKVEDATRGSAQSTSTISTTGEHSINVCAAHGETTLGLIFCSLPPGAVFVKAVQKDTWAATAELHPGDELQAVNGVHAADMAKETFIAAMAQRPLSLSILRRSHADADTNSCSSCNHCSVETSGDTGSELGADEVPELSLPVREMLIERNAGKLGLSFRSLPPGTVIVKEAQAGTWASFANLRPGDELQAINGIEVAGMARVEFFNVMQQRPLSLRIQPSGQSHEESGRSSVDATDRSRDDCAAPGSTRYFDLTHDDSDHEHRSESDGGREHDCSQLREQLRELERLHDCYVEKFILDSAAIVRKIGPQPIKLAQPYFDAIARKRDAEAALDAIAKRLSSESARYQRKVEALRRNDMYAIGSWEELGALNDLETELESDTILRAAVAELEAQLDVLSVQYSEATIALQDARERAATFDRRYRPHEPGGVVEVAQSFFEKKWRNEKRIKITRCRMEKLSAKLKRLETSVGP